MQTLECGSAVKRLVSMAILALAIVTVPALAQKADRPDVKVGDQWQLGMYSGPTPLGTLTRVVTSVTPAGIKGTEGGQPLALTLDLNNIESPQLLSSDLRLLSFPLEVGTQWSFTDDYVLKESGEKGRSSINVLVIGYEKVQVPAGEFDAFKLEAKGSYSGSAGDGTSTRTYWYAPAARAIVKNEFKSTHQFYTITQLEKFQLQP